MAIEVNHDVDILYQGLRRGAQWPAFFLSFYTVAYMLVILIESAKVDRQIDGMVHNLVDVTILFMEHDLVKARNLKLLLCDFVEPLG